MQFFLPLLRPVAVVTAAWSLVACASTDYHFSQLSGARYYRPRSTPIRSRSSESTTRT